MKRPIALLFCLLMITMPMAGCLGGGAPDAPDEELGDWNVHFSATAADLPTCDEDTNGRLYYVEADNQFQVCKTTGWEVIAIQGADGQDGADGQNGADGQDGASGVDGQDGATGPQGPAGADGQDGADGADGQNGADGQDGISILINAKTSTCANGGNAFDIGQDTNSDGILDANEVVISIDVCNGIDGQDGADGQNGAQGPMGPQGPPGVNGTNGTDGAQGPVGPQGPQGYQGLIGYQGYPGQPGVNGTDGADGQDGATGAQGPIGPQGLPGVNGTNGTDGNDASIGFQMTYEAPNFSTSWTKPNISSFNTFPFPYIHGTYTDQKNAVEFLDISVVDQSNNNQKTYLDSIGKGDTLEIRNNDDFAIYEIIEIFYINASLHPQIPVSYFQFTLSMISMGGNNSFSLNNDYSFIFDRGYSPIYEFANQYSNPHFTVQYVGGTLTINNPYYSNAFGSYSIHVVNHHAGSTHNASSFLGTTTTLNIGGGDIIEIFITHSGIEAWNAYEITIINHNHFFEKSY